jgi:spermidine synthase
MHSNPVSGPTQVPFTVEEFEGHRVLIADGVIHSVALGKEDPPFGYWVAMLPERPPRSALLLGVGGGTLAHLLTRHHPTIGILGVDSNTDLITFARTHFALDLPNLEIVLDDAFAFVERTDRQFDYVAVDLFNGHTLPRAVLGRPFLRRLRAIVSADGEIAFNLFHDRRSKQHLARIARLLTIRRTEWLPFNVVAHCAVAP